MVRSANRDDFDSISRLYRQLQPDDPPVVPASHAATFEQILRQPGLDLLVLVVGDEVVGTSYLNVIPNLSRGARPDAVIENVVVDERLRVPRMSLTGPAGRQLARLRG